MPCLFDSRWEGAHGIGRFAEELGNRLDVERISLQGRPMAPWDCLTLPWALRSRRAPGQFFLSPGYNAPLFGSMPYFMTVHDLNHVDRPENSSALKRIYYQTILRRLCVKAELVFTVSEYSRSRILDWMKLSPERVVNVGNGISREFSVSGKHLYKNKKYVLCVGNRKGHKNEGAALAAFASARLPGVSLVFTGSPTQALMDQAEALDVRASMSFAGRLTEPDLAALYRGASVVLFPSLYEGFGLPIVEGFASGVPVVTSNVTSMPEVAAGAAVLVDPTNVDDIRDGLSRAYHDEPLRQALIQRGMARAEDFTWEKVAAQVKAAINARGFLL